MRNKSSGFYASSLEMLLDTMCNMLGGVVFIALMVALVARDSTPQVTVARESAAQMQQELAAALASNNLVQIQLHELNQRLQDPNLRPQTNFMHLPNLTNTIKQPWVVILQYGKAYPLDVMPGSINGVTILNRSGIIFDPHQQYIETRPGRGEEPVTSVIQAINNFKESTRTNFYFAFLVYDDSFPAFIHARETATRLGYEYGWNPLPHNQRIRAGRSGERVLPQN